MATVADLDRIARSFDGVNVGRYWDDERAYLLNGRGGKLDLCWQSKQP